MCVSDRKCNQQRKRKIKKKKQSYLLSRIILATRTFPTSHLITPPEAVRKTETEREKKKILSLSLHHRKWTLFSISVRPPRTLHVPCYLPLGIFCNYLLQPFWQHLLITWRKFGRHEEDGKKNENLVVLFTTTVEKVWNSLWCFFFRFFSLFLSFFGLFSSSSLSSSSFFSLSFSFLFLFCVFFPFLLCLSFLRFYFCLSLVVYLSFNAVIFFLSLSLLFFFLYFSSDCFFVCLFLPFPPF